MPLHEKEIKRALTLRASSIGDTLMGKYFLENIHTVAPDATCTILVGSRAGMIRDLFTAYPWIEVLEVNRHHPIKIFKAYWRLRGQDITLTQYAKNPFSLPSKLFARLVTKRGRLFGFYDRFGANRFIYDHILPFEGEERSGGMITEEQKALSAAGIPTSVPGFTLQYVKDPNVLARFRLEPQAYIVAHLFAGTEGRSISQEKRTGLVQALRGALPSAYTLVLTGTQAEHDRLQDACEGLSGVSVLAGKTTLQELINLVAAARGTVALDSGTAHIAAHLRAPLVVLTRQAALHGWWGAAMYNNYPTVLSNSAANDSSPERGLYAPSLETIETSHIVRAIVDLL